jgi:cobalt-precorrin-5B (C1)-methyltransferase
MDQERAELRRGWTTGACAAAAVKAAYLALLTGRFPDPVQIRLPRGEKPRFDLGSRFAMRDVGLRDKPGGSRGATELAAEIGVNKADQW